MTFSYLLLKWWANISPKKMSKSVRLLTILVLIISAFFTELQELYDKYNEKGLVVLGVPSNQFGGQEPGSNSEIKDFCETNFNITFPMTTKINVKGENAHPIYLWAKENYGNAAVPKWNFHKILINKHGKIEDTYSSFTKPMSKKLTSKIEEIL